MRAAQASNVIELYQRHAKLWEELRAGPFIEQQWLDRFLAMLNPAKPDILDLGCGTGKPMASYLIDRGCIVSGIDGSRALIDRARSAFPDQIWITADMRDLPPLKRYHGIIAWHSLFHLTPDEQRPMFEVFAHLSTAGTALMFTSGTTHGESFGTFAGQPLYHGSLDSSEYRDLLRANGFDVVQHVENDANCGGATVWLAQKAG